MISGVFVRVLGPLEIISPSGPVVIHGRVLRTLLARLAVRPGETVTRQALTEALWEGEVPRTAITTLRSHLTRLRQDLRAGGLPDLIVARGDGFAMDAPGEVLDAVRFENLAGAGRDALLAGDPAAAVGAMSSALELWRGDALADCRMSDWIRVEASRLGEMKLAATEDLLEARIAVGEHATAVAELESRVNRFPFRERLWELMMCALYRSGRQAEALAAFRRARAVLVDELGIEPGPGLRRLESAILAGDEPVTANVHENVVVRQVERTSRKGNLPAEMTSFVGRHDELVEAKKLLSRSRMVTLTGVGGVGKSRLTLHVAATMQATFPDGTWLVELAGLRDPDLVGHAVADAMNIVDWADGGPVGSVIRTLRDGQALLILDNCEHLLNACAQLAKTLLQAAPNLRILATSRQPLAVPGEHILPVPPLLLPDSDDLNAAMTLFADRANAAVPGGFEILPENGTFVARICQQLDGIPLAIELAAVRLRVLSPDQLLDRLDDRLKLLASGRRTELPRHQTLRATIDWSFNLCTREEQALWVRLSVFAGTFDLASAEAVCGDADFQCDDFLSTMDGLVDKSILIREVHSGAVRFRLLAILGGYGRDRLRIEGLEKSVLIRHRDWYLKLAEDCARNWYGPSQLDWLSRLRREHADLRAALDFCLSTPGEHLAGLRLAAALHSFWVGCDLVSEGQHWLDMALKVSTEPTRERAHALWVCGRVTYLQGDLAGGTAKLEESLALARQLDDQVALACATHMLGAAALLGDDPILAQARLREAIERYRALDALDGPIGVAVMAKVHLGMADIFLGDPAEAILRCEEARAICEQHGGQWALSYALYVLAFAQWRLGNRDSARGNARQALRIKSMYRETVGIAMVVDLLSWIAVDDGLGEDAAVMLGAAAKGWDSVGTPWFGSASWRTPHEDAQVRSRDELGDRLFESAFHRGRALSRDDTTELGLGGGGLQRELRGVTTGAD
jgi:predicted ATPase/DNA-binding SARP family transcriptional activator